MAKNLAYKEVEVPYRLPKQPIFKLKSRFIVISDFKWLEPIKTDPTRQDWNRRCSYHKDHDHTIEQCKSLHYLVEKLIKAKYLRQYVRTTRKQRETTPKAIVQAPASPKAPKVIINYIHEGSIDDKHSSRRQRRRLLYATSVRERMNSV
uniref:Uncharacterized protein n=1 Tax=Vitis vinifera TaxID=29760 RepID=A5AQC0_VITVI|nr:hypothetical protein VITISV_026787 [Vitis vinifera]